MKIRRVSLCSARLWGFAQQHMREAGYPPQDRSTACSGVSRSSQRARYLSDDFHDVIQCRLQLPRCKTLARKASVAEALAEDVVEACGGYAQIVLRHLAQVGATIQLTP